jgi:hypothetical protein
MDPFITAQQLSDFLGEDVTVDADAALAISAACDICRTETEQVLSLVEDEAIVLDGSGTDALVLPQVPVVDVSLVEVAAYYGGTSDVVDPADYRISAEGVLLRVDHGWWRSGRQNIEVIYSHGYAADDLPNDLLMVALTVARRLLEGGDVQSESLGSYRVQYVGQASDLSVGEQRILRKYRRT